METTLRHNSRAKNKTDDTELDEVGSSINPIRLIAINKYPELLAYVSANMPLHWWYALRLKWCDDWGGACYLEYHLWTVASRIAWREHWQIPVGREYVRKMSGLAIAELADPTRFRHADAWQMRAAWLGVSKSRWFAVWRSRYETIYWELESWTSRGCRWMVVSAERIASRREMA